MSASVPTSHIDPRTTDPSASVCSTLTLAQLAAISAIAAAKK
jgi:hypothetical protein